MVIGHIGVIHPSLEKKLGLKSRAVMFELELDKLTPAKVPVAAEFSSSLPTVVTSPWWLIVKSWPVMSSQ